MALEIVTVPCLSDNFAYLLRDDDTGATACVDVPDAGAILTALSERGWGLDQILITHHHSDHVQGVAELVAATGARTVGAAADAHRLPPLDVEVTRGDIIQVGRAKGVVRDAAGHTVGHIAFHFPGEAMLFSADSLMAAGCGRLFEGTPDQMWETLSAFAAYPAETLVFSGHDYLAANLRFAAAMEPDNAAIAERVAKVAGMKARGELPMPWTLEEERATNPFLRAGHPALAKAVGLPPGTPAVKVFAAVRAAKDRF